MKTLLSLATKSLILLTLFATSCSTDWYADDDNNSAAPTNQPSSEWGTGAPVDASNPDDIAGATSVQDGRVRQGTPPSTTTNVQHPPRIFDHVPSVTTTSDQTLYLPFNFEITSSDGLRHVFVQVDGADSYWDIRYTASNYINGSILLEIKLPPNIVTPGQFTINYRIQDDFGLVSNVLSTVVKVVDVGPCDDFFEGNDGLTVRSFDLGPIPGRVRITFDMYSVPDRLDVFYGGQWAGGTGSRLSSGQHPPVSECYDDTDGYVSGSNFFDIQHDPNKSRRLDIYASGCVGGGTAWIIWLECPQ